MHACILLIRCWSFNRFADLHRASEVNPSPRRAKFRDHGRFDSRPVPRSVAKPPDGRPINRPLVRQPVEGKLFAILLSLSLYFFSPMEPFNNASLCTEHKVGYLVFTFRISRIDGRLLGKNLAGRQMIKSGEHRTYTRENFKHYLCIVWARVRFTEELNLAVMIVLIKPETNLKTGI